MSKPFITRQEALAKIGKLEAELAAAKASKAPAAAVARQVETVTRQAAADFSAARRESASVTAAEYLASIAPPKMTREEWQKLGPAAKSGWIRSGGKIA